jgi:hypothetical protein
VNFDDPFDRGLRVYRLSRNPAGGVNLPRAAKTEKRYLCAEQVADRLDEIHVNLRYPGDVG